MLQANALLLEIVCCLLRLAGDAHLRKVPDAGDRITEEAVRYLDNHFTEGCSLQVLAKAIHLSPNHLHAVFHQKMGMTPYEYTVGKRIERAKQLIRAGEYPLSRIAEEAAKQCGRAALPKVFLPMSYKEALASAREAELSIFCYEGDGTKSLKKILSENENARSVSIVIGSEGGFSLEEAEAAKNAGLQAANLGPRILRCETAPSYALSAISYFFELEE